MEDAICPTCKRPEEVRTTYHVVFQREGNALKVEKGMIEAETMCDGCGAAFPDERTEGLVRDRYPEFFESVA